MITALIINIVLAVLVLTAVVGALAWSIASQNVEAVTGTVRIARRRRHATARA